MMPAIATGRVVKRRAHGKLRGPCAFARKLVRNVDRWEKQSQQKLKRLEEDSEWFLSVLKQRANEGEVSWHTAVQQAQRYSQLQETVRRVEQEFHQDLLDFKKGVLHDCQHHGCVLCPREAAVNDDAAVVEGA